MSIRLVLPLTKEMNHEKPSWQEEEEVQFHSEKPVHLHVPSLPHLVGRHLLFHQKHQKLNSYKVNQSLSRIPTLLYRTLLRLSRLRTEEEEGTIEDRLCPSTISQLVREVQFELLMPPRTIKINVNRLGQQLQIPLNTKKVVHNQ